MNATTTMWIDTVQLPGGSVRSVMDYSTAVTVVRNVTIASIYSILSRSLALRQVLSSYRQR